MKTHIFFTVITVGLLAALAFMLLGAGEQQQPQVTLQMVYDKLTALQDQVKERLRGLPSDLCRWRICLNWVAC